ncbi:MAG: hypothetical protein LUI39_01615 [Lachnospiraceae bacterium]|nr:hypothetical protein [Lachnospiraceae bacterium]
MHPAIADSLSHVVRYMEERDAKEVREQRRRMGVYWMVTKATETYCNEQHSCRDCRASFAARLKEAGANDIVIEYLYGTKESFLKAYKHAYAHPSPDRIKEAVLRLN